KKEPLTLTSHVPAGRATSRFIKLLTHGPNKNRTAAPKAPPNPTSLIPLDHHPPLSLQQVAIRHKQADSPARRKGSRTTIPCPLNPTDPIATSPPEPST